MTVQYCEISWEIPVEWFWMYKLHSGFYREILYSLIASLESLEMINILVDTAAYSAQMLQLFIVRKRKSSKLFLCGFCNIFCWFARETMTIWQYGFRNTFFKLQCAKTLCVLCVFQGKWEAFQGWKNYINALSVLRIYTFIRVFLGSMLSFHWFKNINQAKILL